MTYATRGSTSSQAGADVMMHNTQPTSPRTTNNGHDIHRPEHRPPAPQAQGQWGDLTSRIEHWRRSIPDEQKDPRVHRTDHNLNGIDITRSGAQGRLDIDPQGTVTQQKELHTRAGLEEQEKISNLRTSRPISNSRRSSSRTALIVAQENGNVLSPEFQKAESHPDEGEKEVDKSESESEISSDDDFDESV